MISSGKRELHQTKLTLGPLFMTNHFCEKGDLCPNQKQAKPRHT
jgi:hypothetical protein